MSIQSTPDVRLQVVADGSVNTKILKLAAYVLGAAALSIAATGGWNRGINFPTSLAWSSVGCAAAMIAMLAPGSIRRAVAGNANKGAVALGAAYALALTMSVTVALGSAAGGRIAASDSAEASSAARKRHQASYETTTAELTTLAPSRPAAEVRAMMAPLTAKIGANDCGGWLPDKATRAACASRHALAIELARAERRTELLGQQQSASNALNAPPAAPANSDAAAIASYLGAVGVQVSADTVSKWLVLLAVGLLDVAPGLLLAGLASSTEESAVVADGGTHNESVPQPAQTPMSSLGTLESDPIVARLQAGPIQGRQTDLAAMFGLPVTSFRRRLESLPQVRMTAGRDCSRLELVA